MSENIALGCFSKLNMFSNEKKLIAFLDVCKHLKHITPSHLVFDRGCH